MKLNKEISDASVSVRAKIWDFLALRLKVSLPLPCKWCTQIKHQGELCQIEIFNLGR